MFSDCFVSEKLHAKSNSFRFAPESNFKLVQPCTLLEIRYLSCLQIYTLEMTKEKQYSFYKSQDLCVLFMEHNPSPL